MKEKSSPGKCFISFKNSNMKYENIKHILVYKYYISYSLLSLFNK